MTTRPRPHSHTISRPGRPRRSLTGAAPRAGAVVVLLVGLAGCSYQQHLGDVGDAGSDSGRDAQQDVAAQQDVGAQQDTATQPDGPQSGPLPCSGFPLRAVWGSGPSDVWAVGYWSGAPGCGQTGIIHWDGTAWSPGGGCLDQRTYIRHRAVWGSGADDVWVVGDAAWRWDGTAWTAMIPAFDDLRSANAVWGSGAADVWIGGGRAGWPGLVQYLLYDGADFAQVPPVSPYAPLGLWGASADDVFAVGDAGMILHYDGASWVAMDSGTDEVLYGVWGSSATDVFAVGAASTVLHYDGTTWSPMSSGGTALPRGVWGASAHDVFAVGDAGTILRYDGTAWADMDSGTTLSLYGVWGSSGSDVWAVGGGPYAGEGIALHWNGTVWTSATCFPCETWP